MLGSSQKSEAKIVVLIISFQKEEERGQRNVENFGYKNKEIFKELRNWK